MAVNGTICEGSQDLCFDGKCTLKCSVEGEIRLVGSDLEVDGRLEICHDNKWGSVGDSYFDAKAARTVCRQLGLTGGTVIYNIFGSDIDLIWLDDIQCF
eukprot:gene25193-11015_t